MFTEDELEDDLNAVLDADPDLLIAGDEDIADEPTPDKKPQEDPIDNETRQLLADIKAERKLASQPRPVETVVERPAPAPQVPQFDEDKAAADFEAAILADPKNAFKQIMGLVKGVAQAQQAQTSEAISRVSMGGADAAVESFMNRMRNDPRMDNEVQAEVERLVERARATNGAAIARMSRAQINAALEEAQAQAYGTVALKRTPTRRVSEPAPRYASGGGGAKPVRATPTLTADERGFLAGLRESLPGISNKDLQIELRDYRKEMGRAS